MPYTDALTASALRDKVKEFPSDSSLKFTNVPEDRLKAFRMNLILSGFIGVKVEEGGVFAATPKVY